MEIHQLERLQREHEKELYDTEEKLAQCWKFHSDYIALRERLRTLPDKVTHDVMVPFGSLAFMPGQLVHTNEILVLLGDNYFVERSACQAAAIVSRRVKELDKNIESLKKQRELLIPRSQFTGEMINLSSGGAGMKEIVEPYDEEAEKIWREKHRENLRRARQRREKQRDAAKDTTSVEEGQTVSDEDLWKRLDELEVQERRGRELERLGFDDTEHTGSKKKDSEHQNVEQPLGDSYDDDDEEDEEDEDEDEENDSPSVKRIINFSHSKVEPGTLSYSDCTATSDSAPLINSPADIYRLVSSAPKSILKAAEAEGDREVRTKGTDKDRHQKTVTFVSPTDAGNVSDRGASRDSSQEMDCSGDRSVSEQRAVSHIKAFTGEVLEKPLTPAAVAGLADAQKGEKSLGSSSSRPVSKFRASRQKQGSST